MEWKVTFSKDMRKTALIQLCPSQDTCYLFHIVMMNGMLIIVLHYRSYKFKTCIMMEKVRNDEGEKQCFKLRTIVI